MNKVYLLLGSNQGNCSQILSDACCSIEKYIGKIIQKSSLYESEAWGFSSDNFLNQVVCAQTDLSPRTILSQIHKIEAAAGRIRTNAGGYQARPLDIDILFYNDLVIETDDLIVPHAQLHKRRFTLLPLNEIAPNFIHPVFKTSIHNLLKNSTDESKVWIYKG